MVNGFSPVNEPKTVLPNTLEAPALSQRLKDCFTLIQDPRGVRPRFDRIRKQQESHIG